ncbi:MAG TPA: hypothetical protein VGM14_04395 [Streptosporangiaceae bacterium]|jgi:hypothetical protein
MKLRLGWISALAVSVVALSALTGLTGAGTASAAAPWTHLCINDGSTPFCANSQGTGGAIAVVPVTSSTTNWTYPGINSDGILQGQIKQANVSLCMQLDASGQGFGSLPGGGIDIVRGAACGAAGELSEQWLNRQDGNRTQFVSVWSEVNTPNDVLCMQQFTAGSEVLDFAEPCVEGTGAQDWGTS